MSVPCRGTKSHSHSDAAGPLVAVAHEGATGVLTLNRPKALNALNLDMVRIMAEAVPRLRNDVSVAVVLLRGAGGRAFCAGGDIKTLWEARKAAPRAHVSPSAIQEAFFREEYTLDYALAALNASKPVVALWDGTVMGGGVGISINARFRVATEKTVFAMPETGIGFFPDVGGSYFLPRLPQHFGTFLALTGERLTGAELVHAGLATHYLASTALPAVQRELQHVPAGSHVKVGDTEAAVEAILSRHAHALPPSAYSDADRRQLDWCFSAPDVLGMLLRLRDADGRVFKAATAALGRASPTSLVVTHAQMLRGAKLSLKECYEMELHMAMRFMAGSDFYEGVRSVLIDKDGKPQWNPASLAEVASSDVASYFSHTDGVRGLEL